MLGVFSVLILLISTHTLHAAQVPVAVITDPLNDEARLMGEELGFTGKLTPDTLTGTITYEWEVTAGECVPKTGIGSSFATTLKSEGAITVKLTASYDSKDYETTVTIQSIKPKVTQLGWKDSIPLKKWNPKNVAIVNPVWIQPLNPNDPSKNEPGAYIKNQQAKANLRFEGAQALSRAAVVRIKGTCAELNFLETNTTYTFQNWDADHLILSEALHDSVNQYKNLEIRWSYKVKKLDGSTFGDWVEVNTTSHKPLYTVHSYPCASTVYDFGLEKACGFANGDEDFRGKICEGVSKVGNYDPEEEEHPHDLHMFEGTKTIACCCYTSGFMKLVSHVMGASGREQMYWGGTPDLRCVYKTGFGAESTFQCEAPSKGKACIDPHFMMHMLVELGSTTYDPTYGKSTPPIFLEGAPAHTVGAITHPAVTTFQHAPTPVSPGECGSKWTCSHNSCVW